MNGVSYIQEGEGENLVLLHGYMSCKESFYYQIKYFSKYFKVTAFDFWGFGKSQPISDAWSVSDYAKKTLEFLDCLGIENATLLAHSFGGRVALQLLSEHGNRFKKAVFVGGAGIVKKHGLIYKSKVLSYRIVKKFAPKFAEKKFGSKEYKTLSPIIRESYKKIVNEDLRYCLSKITTPALFIYGKKDRVTPEKYGKIFANGVKDGQFISMSGTHFCFCEYPQLFNGIVREFLL